MNFKKIILVSSFALTAVTFSTVNADEIVKTEIEQNNHPMGYYNVSTERANAPSDLNSSDNSLPRKDAVDLASYQSWMTQADFNQLKAQGVKTAVIKLTEGTYYKNPYAESHIRMARNAGLNIATYHFAIFGSTSNQTTANNHAIAEANYYAQEAKRLGINPKTVMIEDAEYTPTAASIWNQASQNFTQQLKNQGYDQIRYYTSKSWAENGTLKPATFGAKNFWIAQYLYGKPSNSNLQNTQYGAWQYSSQMYFANTSQKKPIDTSIDYNNIFQTAASNDVYRMYNHNSGEHFYTMSYYEVTQLQKAGWHYEGIGWQSATTKTGGVHRLYNKNGGYHFYTMSTYEKDELVKKGWNYEGISFYTGGTKPVYRAYNPNNGMHNYTLNSYEQNSLIKLGWKNEGTAWKSY